jgi:2-polyprenyl-3-methyl-5-hydroxy-6-metoxy-1,4-benzoquinol methylase
LEDYKKRIYERYASLMYAREYIQRSNRKMSEGRGYSRLLKGWLPDKLEASILEVGCGSGALLGYLQEMGFRNIIGIDISGEQVSLAKNACDKVERADAIEFLRDHRESFDLIVALDLIEHLNKREILTFLERCNKALKHNGRLVLQTPNAESPWGMGVVQGDFTHEVSFTPVSLTTLLRLCEFKGIEVRGISPRVHGIRSLVRLIIWKLICVTLAIYNLSETGKIGSGIFSRVFLISGVIASATDESPGWRA